MVSSLASVESFRSCIKFENSGILGFGDASRYLSSKTLPKPLDCARIAASARVSDIFTFPIAAFRLLTLLTKPVENEKGGRSLRNASTQCHARIFDSDLEVYKTDKPYVCLVPLTHAPKGFKQTNIEYVTRDVVVRDIRGFEDRFDIDTHGFTLVKHQTSFTDWYDGKKVVKEYYQHIKDLLKSKLCAREVYIFDHTIRLGDHVETPQRESEIQGLPSQVAHVDHTLASTQREIRNDFGHKADEMLVSRHQIVNVWHPIFRPIEQQPLTLCDYQTAKDDAFPADLVYPHLASENRLIRYSKNQRWYFIDQQRVEEAWMFKISDSEAEDRADVSKFCAHTSFPVPGAKPEALPRESIEFRAYVFY